MQEKFAQFADTSDGFAQFDEWAGLVNAEQNLTLWRTLSREEINCILPPMMINVHSHKLFAWTVRLQETNKL